MPCTVVIDGTPRVSYRDAPEAHRAAWRAHLHILRTYGEDVAQRTKIDVIDTQSGLRSCSKCSGTGLFFRGKRPEVCFCCEGKGHLTRSDHARNAVYWKYYARVA